MNLPARRASSGHVSGHMSTGKHTRAERAERREGPSTSARRAGRHLGRLAALTCAALVCAACSGDEERPPVDDLDESEELVDVEAPDVNTQTASDEAPGEGEDDVPETDDPVSVPAEAAARESTTSQQAFSAGTAVVYVNFGGPVVTDCRAYCSDATRNRSVVIGAQWQKWKVDFDPYRSAEGRKAIVRHLREYFSRWRVSFTTTRPSAGPYTMLVVTPTFGGRDTRGRAPLDCGNAYKSDIAFVFGIGGASPRRIAQYAAHELGHTFGLAHVTRASDLLQYRSSGDAFRRSEYAETGANCTPGAVQDAPAILAQALGLR